MSRITPFQRVQLKQRQIAQASVPLKAPAITVEESHPCLVSPQLVQIVSSFDFAAVRRRGNKSFLVQIESKDVENFPPFLQ